MSGILSTTPPSFDQFNTDAINLLFFQLRPLKARFTSGMADASLTVNEYSSVMRAFAKLKETYRDLERNFSTKPHLVEAVVKAKGSLDIVEKKLHKAKDRYLTLNPAAPGFTSKPHQITKLAEAHPLCVIKRDNSPMQVFSLDHPAEFEFGGLRYPSALHALYAQMYPYDRDLQKQFAAATSAQVFELVLKNDHKRADWHTDFGDGRQLRENILLDVLRAKFGQNPELRECLLSTLDAYLVDASSEDDFWGITEEGKGQNKLGVLLMTLRKEYGGVGLVPRPPFDFATLESAKILPDSLRKTPEEIKREIDELNAAADDAEYMRETKEAQKIENRGCNRCEKMNFSYDKTRVPLSNGRYINANYMYGKTCIGAQAPMHSIEEDFWRMLCEQQCRVSVMLNGPREYLDSWHHETYAYWPADTTTPRVIGPYTIRLLATPTIETHATWKSSISGDLAMHGICHRKLEISYEGKTHILDHFQYLNWPDTGIGNEGCVARLVKRVIEAQGECREPIVAHCAAGVGRTATFLGILEQTMQMYKGKMPDVKASIASQRSSSDGRYYKMTQSDAQYAFCYAVLRRLASEFLSGLYAKALY